MVKEQIDEEYFQNIEKVREDERRNRKLKEIVRSVFGRFATISIGYYCGEIKYVYFWPTGVVINEACYPNTNPHTIIIKKKRNEPKARRLAELVEQEFENEVTLLKKYKV